MIQEHAKKAYLDQDYNCAESVLLAANEAYGLGVTAEMLPLVGGFGGGMGCRSTCGALTGGIAAIGKRYITERAHVTPGLHEVCAAYVKNFTEALGSTNCQELIDKHRGEDKNCIKVVLLAADVLQKTIEAHENA